MYIIIPSVAHASVACGILSIVIVLTARARQQIAACNLHYAALCLQSALLLA